MKKGYSLEEVLVTPEIAKEWLKGHKNIRPLSQKTVLEYLRLMERNAFQVGGGTIQFVGNRLGNGQHRLHAVIIYGHPVYMLVERGLTEDDLRCRDQGKRRSNAHICGMTRGANPIVNMLAIVEPKSKTKHIGHEPRTVFQDEAQWYYDTYRSSIEFVLSLEKGKPNDSAFMATITRAHICGVEEETIADFVSHLRNGISIYPEPISNNISQTMHSLRNALGLNEQGGGRRTQGIYRIRRQLITERGLIAFINSEALKIVRAANKTKWPLPVRFNGV